jgi:hypothetical protein
MDEEKTRRIVAEQKWSEHEQKVICVAPTRCMEVAQDAETGPSTRGPAAAPWLQCL